MHSVVSTQYCNSVTDTQAGGRTDIAPQHIYHAMPMRRAVKKTSQRQLIISIRVYRLPSLNRPRLIHIKPKAIQILTVGMQVSISTTITRINRENTDRRQENYRTLHTLLPYSQVTWTQP